MPGNNRRLSGSTLANDLGNVFVETAVQIARKFLFLDTRQKALFHFILVFLVSGYAYYSPPNSEQYYIAAKNNIFNVYGTKVGWFWTLITVGPFIWLTSFLQCQNSHIKAAQHMIRLVVATAIWHFITSSFIHIERSTRRCQGAKSDDQSKCIVAGGKWIPGVDISGHCFLLIYNILIICEESLAYKNWPRNPKNSSTYVATPSEAQNYRKLTLSVQGLFIILFFFHLFWDFQLIVTCLYYHTFNHKVLGGAAAVIAWFLTYKMFFPIFPGMPNFNSHSKSS
ncbi:hypothetical protein FO519_005105 [Halicephalobus sp. NKZ332]|nr:hypothetical protein FO519_005105 [Halicephalobus sp. NKZ332]